MKAVGLFDLSRFLILMNNLIALKPEPVKTGLGSDGQLRGKLSILLRNSY